MSAIGQKPLSDKDLQQWGGKINFKKIGKVILLIVIAVSMLLIAFN